jgi:hypothetical protein
VSASGTDVLVVSVGGTMGWRAAARELADSLTRAGARVSVVEAEQPRRVRTFALTDLVEARAARRASVRGISEHDPAAVIYCSITAALLWPTPGAIWLDTLAAENRPGRHGVWQRTVERRRLQQAPLLLKMSDEALGPVAIGDRPSVTLPTPVDPSGAAPPTRDIAAITYAADPRKRQLDRVLGAWHEARRGDEKLVVAGLDGLAASPGVEVTGRLAAREYRSLLRRARAFVAAPRREDYGIAPLEALADGCRLVSTPAAGPYPALALARRLDPRLVGEDLARAIRVALDDPQPGYAERAAALLEPFGRAAVDRTVAETVLPRLLSR